MSERKFNLDEARQILTDYPKINEPIDMGNLYFAGSEFCQAYDDLEEKLRVAIEALKTAEAEIAVYSVTAYGHYKHDLPSLVQIRKALAKIKGGSE